MKEILSQAEIDKLLAALSSGSVTVEDLRETEKQVGFKPYDFRRPNKFSKEQLRTLQMLHESFSRILSNFLSGYLRANIIVRVASVDQFTYEDFLRSVPSPTLLTAFSLKPLKGMAVMETNPHFLFPVIDLLFGGPGEAPMQVREFTDIELSVARKVNDKILVNLKLAWSDVFEVEPEIESIETNPRLHQIIGPNEIVAVVTFTTVVEGTARGLINLCLPHVVLDPIISQLSAHYRYADSNAHREDAESKKLNYWLGLSEVDLAAVIGGTEITVREFLQLQPGDVLVLDRRYDEDLDLYVDDRLKFKVQAGASGRYLAVQISSLAEEVGEDVG
ncbi:MAG: flagellar motor switch protein FliM [Deltaproteobacteria bacterium]|nr:flagellar motor switch protein FliM [Deltaproteobacteria bacterium]